jgi:Haemolymph juvenile hormone binding protein (JHBP)
MTNLNIRGLQPFILDDIHMEIFGLWVRFDARWDVLNIDGQHSSSGVLSQQPFSGSGNANVVVRNFRVFGIVSMNTIPGNFLNLREIRFTIEAGDVRAELGGLSASVNAAVNSALLPTLRLPETQAAINARVNENVLPFANSILNTMTMPDLIFLMSQRASNPPPRRCFL